MSKIFKCGECGHISRLAKRKITHARTCKTVKRRAPRIRPTRAGYPGNEEWQKLATTPAPAVDGILTREQFIAKLLSIKGDKSLHTFAPDLKVSYQFLGHVIKGDFPPGPKIAEAMGYEQVVMFKPGKKKAIVPRIDKRQLRLDMDKANAEAR